MKVKSVIYLTFILFLIFFGIFVIVSSNNELRAGTGIYIADYGLENNRYEWGISACDWALEDNPENNEILIRKVKLLAALERYDEAYMLQKKVISGDASKAVSDWERLGYLGVKTGDYKGAVLAYESALSCTIEEEKSGKMDISDNEKKADLLIKLQRYDEAILIYQSLVEKEPENPSIWIGLGDAYLYKSLLASGQLKDMYSTLSLERPEEKKSASFDMSSFESHRKAVDAYNKAVELDPMVYPIIAAKILGNYEKTINNYQDILKGMNG
ncbi:tetratricopeptide repeat protein [Methanomicrobium antiquum]|uniref:Tetratricopeptide repeat protein n=1 Tax=Methanomicrobium antiquum TaxID=487686 RepID=A0AAF0JM09_9EURY|nr:tetratricopeptide repeat protein [Methanomicrobium antiquum]MDD3977062.1 tetratricopeptide repeat protein [Methanomicrobium sp.]WFN36642.1 tetratricopeptide repeat protein [Methanomicrobium antiquum]